MEVFFSFFDHILIYYPNIFFGGLFLLFFPLMLFFFVGIVALYRKIKRLSFKKKKIATHNVLIHNFYTVFSIPNGLLTLVEQYSEKIIKRIEKEILLPGKNKK